MDKTKLKTLFILHILLMVYSMSGICSKMAAGQNFLSFKFCLFYSCVIILLAVYAVVWQQIIKRLPLTTAYANKAVTVAWGLVWGIIFFYENVTFGKVAGIFIVIAGIVIYSLADREKTK